MTARVLVVEGQKLVRQGIRAELSRNGVRDIIETASGAEAVAAVALDPPDVVLLGFELPDRSGPEICAALLDRHPSLTVIVLSGHRDEASARAALDAGARGYLLADEDDLDLSLAIERSLAGEPSEGAEQRRVARTTTRAPPATGGIRARALQSGARTP